MRRALVLCISLVASSVGWLHSTTTASAAPPTEVSISVASSRAWVHSNNLTGDTIFVVVEVINTSAYRVNAYAIAQIYYWQTGALVQSESLYDVAPIASLAPGQRAPVLMSHHFGTTNMNVEVLAVGAGGYVTGAPDTAIGVSTTGPVTYDSTDDSSDVPVEVRNTTHESVRVRAVVGTFYDADGEIVAVGTVEVDDQLDPGEAHQYLVSGIGSGGLASSARVGGRAVLGASPNDSTVVSWTNWFHDVGASSFQADIAWVAERGITVGCGAFVYCPTQQVTRGQMASFLVRALHLPSTTTDFFSDDETSVHEADINALRAAGLTSGCGATTYCPTQQVTRGQMASFLVRALDLPSSTTDYFSDDETSSHEADINAFAKAGLTYGCGGGKYCPTAGVTRGEMAAFLHRAL